MPIKKKITGRAAKQKGSRAERKVRDLLRSIYPTELRDNVYRVPLSGGGSIKGDVFDANDPEFLYEVKCQETLVLHDWWRQAKHQAGSYKVPVLVVTQSYRPFYFIMQEDDWEATRTNSLLSDFDEKVEMTTTKFMDKAGELEEHQVGKLELDGDYVVVIPQQFYLAVKSWQAAEKSDIMESEPKG